VIGPLHVRVTASSEPVDHVYGVEFILDDESYVFDAEAPYEWDLDLPLQGIHNLTVKAHSPYGEWESQSVLFFGLSRGR
jgi:hypothetical protein